MIQKLFSLMLLPVGASILISFDAKAANDGSLTDTVRLFQVLNTPKKILDFIGLMDPSEDFTQLKNRMTANSSNDNWNAKILVEEKSIVLGHKKNAIQIEPNGSLSFQGVQWKPGKNKSLEKTYLSVQKLWKLQNLSSSRNPKLNWLLSSAWAQSSGMELAKTYLALIPTFVEWTQNSDQLLNFTRLMNVQRYFEKNSLLNDTASGTLKLPIRLECGGGYTRTHKIILAGETAESVLEIKIAMSGAQSATYDGQQIVQDGKFVRGGKKYHAVESTAYKFQVYQLDQFCVKHREVAELNRKLAEMNTSLLQKQNEMKKSPGGTN